MIPYRDNIPCQHTPWVTWGLIAANFGVFLLLFAAIEKLRMHWLYLFGLVPLRFVSPEWAHRVGFPVDDYAPFITSMFMHGGWWHLIANMWLLWIFGDNVEDRMGKLRFFAFYLLCGVIAGALQLAATPHSNVPVIGASGALAGVMGAFFFMYPYAKIVIWVLFLPLFVQLPAIAFLGLWVIMQLYKATSGLANTSAYLDVAWWGHLGGFIAGMILHRFFLLPDRVKHLGFSP